ncbi:MAG TPA: hypothetical protein VFI52_01200 [Gemmatimonadaceae bacterium]|nr:hypothetical protein [Gemmatimonadaceae bacterium]
MRRLLFAFVPLFVATQADAQIIRPGMRFGEPSGWVSFGAALVNTFDVRDGTTNSIWQFGDATQYAVSLEKPISGSGVTLGVRGTHMRAPLFYSGSEATDADANVSQVMAVLHVASGREFHSVLELSAGATIFSNFRSRTTDARLAPMSPDADFAFAFGYGFGYNFSPTFAIDALQDVSTSLHQKTGLSASESSSIRFTSTRIVARFGLGAR